VQTSAVCMCAEAARALCMYVCVYEREGREGAPAAWRGVGWPYSPVCLPTPAGRLRIEVLSENVCFERGRHGCRNCWVAAPKHGCAFSL
jgi:hypothetical protein